MEDNRFKRAYLEYQQEKGNIRAPVGRFNNVCYYETPQKEFNRFLTPVNNDIIYLPKETFGRKPVELVKPIKPVELVELVKPIKPVELVKPANIIYLPRETFGRNPVELVKPVKSVEPASTAPVIESPSIRQRTITNHAVPGIVTVNNTYHFPELLKTTPNKNNIVISESKKEMITKNINAPAQKTPMTLLSLKNGKVRQTEVFENISEPSITMIKKPNYSSWASVLKPEINYYDLDDKKIIDMS